MSGYWDLGKYHRGAITLCRRPQFWRYIEFHEPGVDVRHPEVARDWMCATLDIQSRRELDESEEAAAKYLAMLNDFNTYLSTGYQKIPKQKVWRNDDYRAIAQLAPCMRCNRCQGTGKVVGAHIMGPIASMHHKGWSMKPDDFCIAFICDTCHRVMDAYDNAETEQARVLEWLVLVLRTHEWMFRHGFVVVTRDPDAPPEIPNG